VTTSVSINRIKWGHGSAVLPAIAQFRNAMSQKDLENAFNGLLNIYVNGKELKLSVKTRMEEAEKMTPQRITEIHEALRTGELLENRNVPDHKLFRTLNQWKSAAYHDASWRPPNDEYRWGQFHQIPPLYGFHSEHLHLWTTIDEEGNTVFYPFSPLTKPFVRWTAWVNECWWTERWHRMRNYCNKRFSMECTIETLMMEALHCRFQRLKEDREALQLYMVSTSRIQLSIVTNN
jgi:hypothetical protein